jgi:hypothetical protein
MLLDMSILISIKMYIESCFKRQKASDRQSEGKGRLAIGIYRHNFKLGYISNFHTIDEQPKRIFHPFGS